MAIQPHNEMAAATWGSGGAEYDRVGETIADSARLTLGRAALPTGT